MSSPSHAAGRDVEQRLANLSPDKRRLLEALVRGHTAEPHIPKLGLQRAPLSFGQERLWFLHQLDPSDTSYHLHFHLTLPQTLDANRWRDAWSRLVERHEVLRTRFVPAEHGLEQVVDPAEQVTLAEYDLRDLPA